MVCGGRERVLDMADRIWILARIQLQNATYSAEAHDPRDGLAVCQTVEEQCGVETMRVSYGFFYLLSPVFGCGVLWDWR